MDATIILELLGWFLILATIADTLFVPNLSSLSKIFKLNDAIAGVTLVAFGNGAGDIFTAISSFSFQPELAIGDMIGSSIFVTVCTFGVIKFITAVEAERAVVVDLLYFVVVIVIWGMFIKFGRIDMLGIVSLVVLYALYVFMTCYNSESTGESPDSPFFVRRIPILIDSYLAVQTENTDDNDILETQDLHANERQDTSDVISYPTETQHLLSSTVSVEDFFEYNSTIAQPVKFDWHRELSYTLRHLFPLIYEWEFLAISSRIFGLITLPIVLILNLTVPVIHQHYLEAVSHTHVVNLGDTRLETNQEVENDYPKLLLYFLLKTIYSLQK